MSPRLPPETWAEVFRNLDHPDWIQLRQVCRAFGTIGAKSLFSSIRIYLFRTDTYGALGEGLETVDEREEVIGGPAKGLTVKSWEILDHITRNPNFAVLVRTLIVYANGFPQDFEYLCLENAIRKLPCLTNFRWLGSQGVPDIVAQSLPDSLTSLCLPGIPETDSFAHLRHLCEMAVKACQYEEDHTIFQNLIANNTESLRILSLPSNLCAGLPVRLFDNLTHLHIGFFGESTVGFEFALRHVTVIESLSLRLDIPGHEIEIVHSLLDNSDAFTNLVSLQLSFVSHVPDRWRADLISFIRERRKLRRLYLDSIAVNMGPEVYSLIRALPDLQVLGLEPCHPAYRHNYPPDYLHHFLPQQLKGFHAKLSSHAFREESANLLDEFGRFKGLTYFSLRDDRSSLLKPAAFAADKPLLRFIGRNEELFDVRADRSMPIRWPKLKTGNTVQDDFDDEDEWWLHNAAHKFAKRYDDD
ncbi:hypothetical protein APHAL10511_004759 [Amanita phalloides]|nr:hypothetical protein APHAL10511_004759 [Amanita phalloides]